MEKNQYDVIIVGAGPAGVSAAITCHRNGLNTLIITAKSIGSTHNKTVIESIHPGVMSLLGQLDAAKNFSDCVVGSYSYISNGKHRTSLNPYTSEVWTGYHILKNRFNELLLNEAIKLGITVYRHHVTDMIKTDNGVVGIEAGPSRLYSSLVIDASGRKSLASKKLKLYRQDFSTNLFVTSGQTFASIAEMQDNDCAYFLFRPGGWTWTGRLFDGGYYWTNLSMEKKPEFLRPSYLRNKGEPIDYSSTANMKWRMVRPLCLQGLILCGDSACLIDPASGQGILNALMSGIQAAETALGCIKNKDSASLYLARYDQWLSELFRGKIDQLSSVYSRLAIKPRL